MVKPVQLYGLAEEINDVVYTSGKYPLIMDPSGQAGMFLKYRSRYLSAFNKGDLDKDNLRKSIVQAMHNGAWMVIDFAEMDCDLTEHFADGSFPSCVLSPLDLFLEENYTQLLRPTDDFAGKVTYEHQEALAAGAFQDRTKAHAPERCVDVDSNFAPRDAFRLIVLSKREELPDSMSEGFAVFKLSVSEQQAQDNAGIWAGREKPGASKSKEQVKLDNDLTECAFDGEVDELKKLLDKGADPHAKDGRGHAALSEAAVQGHLDAVRFLLDWRAPIGPDPNAHGSDGRGSLHRAAFQGHHKVVQILLERGADPRLKDRHGERPFDMASNDESRHALETWDTVATDRIREERKRALAEEEEKHVRSAEEKATLERRRRIQRMAEHAASGDRDQLAEELAEIEDQRQIATYRDDRGNNVLHIATEHARADLVTVLVDDFCVDVNCQESKGWTPIAIAAFRGHKAVCRLLMERGADPSKPNAYRKSAFDVAQDDEIRDVLRAVPDCAWLASGGVADERLASEDGEDANAGGKKPKNKAKGSAGDSGDGSGAAGSGAAAAKALAKGKAKGKAKSKTK